MVRYKVSLETLNDVLDMINKMREADSPVYLTDKDRTKKLGTSSLLSELTALDWAEVWVESDDDKLYSLIKEYVI